LVRLHPNVKGSRFVTNLISTVPKRGAPQTTTTTVHNNCPLRAD
jgi:hypothetical protein